jgi:hypothetical protein
MVERTTYSPASEATNDKRLLRAIEEMQRKHKRARQEARKWVIENYHLLLKKEK